MISLHRKWQLRLLNNWRGFYQIAQKEYRWYFLIFLQTRKISDFVFVAALFASVTSIKCEQASFSQDCLEWKLSPSISSTLITLCDLWNSNTFHVLPGKQTFKSWQGMRLKKLISQLILELVAAKRVCSSALTSCGTWMKAKVYSVACAGRVLVPKAGGMAARRVLDTTSLWGKTGKKI